jgi:ribosomal protein L32
MAANYQVLFGGQFTAGTDPATARRAAAGLLAIDERELSQIFSGRTVVVRSHLGAEEALALQARLAELGLICWLKDGAAKAAEIGVPATLRSITAAHTACPQCGHMQLEVDVCARCGTDLAALMRRRRKEDLIIEKQIRALRARRTVDEHPDEPPQPGRPRLGRIAGWLKRSN